MSVQKFRFRYQLSDLTLFSWTCRLQTVAFGLDAESVPMPALEPGSQGLLLRSAPLAADVPTVGTVTHDGQRLLRYVLQRFPRHYIDMSGNDFAAYQAKFSGKTRSTLTRKVRKFAEASGGALRWERFAAPEQMDRFWHLARQVSSKTYQERLLDAGLPDDDAYRAAALQWAREDRLRAFLLFDGERPVSYLFCPEVEGTLIYAYLGYDPEYQRLSVGTVLQWMALESLFEERRYRCFDFTEGESEHKRLFGTGRLACANVALLRPTLANRLLVWSHAGFTRWGEGVGRWLERHGWKRRIRRWLRFGGRTHEATA